MIVFCYRCHWCGVVGVAVVPGGVVVAAGAVIGDIFVVVAAMGFSAINRYLFYSEKHSILHIPNIFLQNTAIFNRKGTKIMRQKKTLVVEIDVQSLVYFSFSSCRYRAMYDTALSLL